MAPFGTPHATDDVRIEPIEARREVAMPALDERIRVLEVSMTEQGAHIVGLRSDVADLRADIRNVRGEMAQLRAEMGQFRGEIVQVRDEMNRRFEAVDRNFAELRKDMSGHFMWLVGILVTSTVGTVTAIVVSFLEVR
jgi:uncharacterized coiled-coil protein SlyX